MELETVPELEETQTRMPSAMTSVSAVTEEELGNVLGQGRRERETAQPCWTYGSAAWKSSSAK